MLHLDDYKRQQQTATSTLLLSTVQKRLQLELAATLRGSRPGVQSTSLIMTSLMTS